MNSIKINIKYRLKDFRDFCLAKKYKGIFGEISLIISSLLLLSISLLVLFTMIYIFIEHEDIELILFLFVTIFFGLLLCAVFALGPFWLSYSACKREYSKNKLLQSLNCMEVTKETITMSDAEGTSTLSWDDIYKVQELRPCFLIYLSPLKSLLIPKRCFISQEQLVNFRGILWGSGLGKRKLKLKNYNLKSSSPDYGEIELRTEPLTEYFEVDNEENPDIVLEITLEKKDLLNTNFITFYSNPLMIIITLLGLLFLISGILNFESLINRATILGTIFVFFPPVMMLIGVNRAYNNDPLLKKPFKYSFYKGHYIIDNATGTSRIDCKKLVKIVEMKSSFLLYISTRFFHMIPKRVFEGKEGELEKFQELMKGYRRHKFQSRVL